jgi:Protein of unknown function (DUF2934)
MDELSLSSCLPPGVMSLPICPPSRVVNFLVEPSMRRELVAQAAYLRAKHRGLEPGHELEDWLAAEAEVDMVLSLDHFDRGH